MLELKQIESFYPAALRSFKRNLLREYLQYKILGFIFSSEYADRLSFMGGTAIHIAHGLPRFSEDLDFDNLGLNKTDFTALTVLIKKKLQLEGYDVEAANSFKGAYGADIKIAGILYENKLSPHKGEKMFIKLDAEPQRFQYAPDKVILNKFDVFAKINVVPPDMLLSQKIYAIFMRRRPIGRDFYDVIFLFGKTKPNLNYLRLKLGVNDISALKLKLIKRCEKLDFKLLVKDIEQFLFVSGDAKKILLFSEYIKDML